MFLIYFALGMIYSVHEERVLTINNNFFLFLCCFGFLILLVFYNCISFDHFNSRPMLDIIRIRLFESILLLASTIPLYIVLLQTPLNQRLKNMKLILLSRTIKSISYSSLCVFLFHRSIWAVMANVWGKGSFFQWIYIMVFGIPLIIVFCYILQSHYEKITNNFFYK